MPVGGKGKPAGGYRAGKKGSYGCAGFPTVSADGTVHGCHPTKARAQAQARAIWASTARKFVSSVEKAMVTEGDFVAFICHDEEMKVGRVEHVMTEGMFGLAGSEYAMEANMEDPVLSIRIYEEEDGAWEETEYTVGHRMSEVLKVESIKVAMDIMVQMTSSGGEMPQMQEDMEEVDSEVAMAMYDSSIGKAYEGCGCPTCKELNVNCENCPVCKAEDMKSEMANAPYEDAEDMEKAKPNYEDMIKPRRSGSTPSNPRLYEAVVREAKDKFDVYPSAVANGWVVQEYKRRGGTYKGESMDKRDYSMDARRDMAASGMAMPDGSFPIANGGDLQNAIQSVGRASNYAAAKEHIVRRARALGMMDMLPEDWRNNATKGMGQWSGSIFDLNPFVK